MDAEQMETLVGMRLAKYPDRACMMQEMTFKDEKIAALETENARLKEALRECVEFMEADCREECEWPCPDSVTCGRKKIFLKAREVLGDASSR